MGTKRTERGGREPGRARLEVKRAPRCSVAIVMDMDDAMGMVDPDAAGLPGRDLTIGEVSDVAGVSADALR